MIIPIFQISVNYFAYQVEFIGRDEDDDEDGSPRDKNNRAQSADSKQPKALKNLLNPNINKIGRPAERNTSPLGTPNSDITVINNTSVRSLEQKILELETVNTNYKRENDELLKQIKNLRLEKEKVFPKVLSNTNRTKSTIRS